MHLADRQSICQHPANPALKESGLKFSLILATVGRTSELERFLTHLDAQSYRKFELILVDQNPDDRLVPLILPYAERFPVIRCRSAIGLSRARNLGLTRASGDIVAFPDDDCWYSNDLLEHVATLFRESPGADCITGRPIDSRVVGFHSSSGPVNRQNVFRRGISYTIFIRDRAVSAVGRFDESLGLGTESGRIAAEETDYLIRALSASCSIFYHAELTVFHTDSPLVYDEDLVQRQYGSSLAFGYVLRKHKYPLWFVSYSWLRPFGGACLSLLAFKWGKARYHYSALTGRITGWFKTQG